MSEEEIKDMNRADTVLTALWRNWALAFGSIALLVFVSIFLRPLWLPFVGLVEAWALSSIIKSNWRGTVNSCSLIVMLAVRILLVSSLIMLGVFIFCTDWLVPKVVYLDLYNTEIPFVTCLIVFPVSAASCAIWLWMGFSDHYCRQCQRRNGYYAGDSIVATLYFKETRYQTAVLLLVSVVIGGIEYWYYFTHYINTNISAPDRFFFNIIPVAMYILSLAFMGGRYKSMRLLLSSVVAASPDRQNRTIVRFLVFCQDELLLRQNVEEQWDTPAELVVPRVESMPMTRARQMFEDIYSHPGVHFDMRYCFTNVGFANGSNIIHYAVFIDPSERDTFAGDNTWFNPYMLDRALATNTLGYILANEIFRLHTITMAWKTYDRNGRRLYPIRHYRPTFRFRDLKDWTVDYDDQTWFDIANNNEDRHFYRLRRFWERLTGGFKRKTTVEE